MNKILLIGVFWVGFLAGAGLNKVIYTNYFEGKILNHEPITIGKSVSICKEQVVEYKDKQ